MTIGVCQRRERRNKEDRAFKKGKWDSCVRQKRDNYWLRVMEERDHCGIPICPEILATFIHSYLIKKLLTFLDRVVYIRGCSIYTSPKGKINTGPVCIMTTT